MNINLQGYSLPLSQDGKFSLVDPPPWYFGGEGFEVVYRADPEIVRKLLPYPLQISDDPGLVSITMLDITSTNTKEAAFLTPERTQYRECLIKLHCSFNGKKGWYVPITWVDKDFSLLRGFIQGFGKKMAHIEITKLNEMNKMIGGKRPGAQIKAICEVFNSVHIELSIKLCRKETVDSLSGNSMYVMRHYPNLEDPNKPIVFELSEVLVIEAERNEIWIGSGEVLLKSNLEEEIVILQPKEIIMARIWNEGFTLIGGRVLYKYDS